MRILFISASFSKDMRKTVHGVYKRMNMFIDGIKKIAELDVLFFVQPDIDVSPAAVAEYERSYSEFWNTNIRLFLCPLPKSQDISNKGKLFKFWYYYGAGAFSFFKQTRFIPFSGPDQIKAFENCLSQNYDLIFVHKLHSMCPLMLTHKPLPPVYFDLDDIEHILFKRSILQLQKWWMKILSYMHLPMILIGERQAIRLAHKTFICSEIDRRYLTDRWRLPGVTVVPNAVEIPDEQPLTKEPTMLFIGSYKFRPNIDAAEFLIEKIWPQVYKKMPSARLIIAGPWYESIHGYDADIPGVSFPGLVIDLDSLYKETKISCVPIFAAGGTRVKIVEAAAYGIPVVATTIGAEGLDMIDNQEIFLRDDAESFSEACLTLFRDDSLCTRLGAAARAKAVQFYDRNNVIQLIQKYLREDRTNS